MAEDKQSKCGWTVDVVVMGSTFMTPGGNRHAGTDG